MPRLAAGLIALAFALLAALTALLLSDQLAPGRLPPRLGFWLATGAGILLVGGVLLPGRPAGRGAGQYFSG
jgi:hypothetical protein